MQHNPRWDVINEAVNKEQITMEERVELINNIEELHTFAGIINRTRRRDIGSFANGELLPLIPNLMRHNRRYTMR